MLMEPVQCTPDTGSWASGKDNIDCQQIAGSNDDVFSVAYTHSLISVPEIQTVETCRSREKYEIVWGLT